MKKAITMVMAMAIVMALTTTATAQKTMGIDRVMDQVVISGKQLAKINGQPIANLRLMAFKGGQLKAMPFQIDELNAAGDYVMKRASGAVDQDEDGGKLDANDELVFMAMDAGDQGDPKAAGIGVTAVAEIILKDPVNGKRGWAYLLAFDKNPPAPSSVSYMKYGSKGDHDELVTPHYTLRFPKNDVFMDALIIHKSAGGNGKDIMDRIKMRSGVSMLMGTVSIDRTENDFAHTVLGVIAGPVRVLRQTETRLVLVGSLKSPAAIVNGSFYPACFQFPSVLELPFRMDLVATDAFMRQGWDLNQNALGLKITTNLNAKPVTYDGKMTNEEKELARSNETLLWALGTGPQGTFLFKGVWDQGKNPIKALIYYEDDKSRLEPPEEDPGVMGIAYRLEDLLSMGGEAYPFNVVNYIVPNYDGAVKSALQVFDHPLEIKVK